MKREWCEGTGKPSRFVSKTRRQCFTCGAMISGDANGNAAAHYPPGDDSRSERARSSYEQGSIFGRPDDEPRRARPGDPDTSHAAAKGAARTAGGQKRRLLAAYAAAADGLTDDEAGEATGLLAGGAGFWKRCAELRNAGLIADTGRRRPGPEHNKPRMVCVITPDGRAALR